MVDLPIEVAGGRQAVVFQDNGDGTHSMRVTESGGLLPLAAASFTRPADTLTYASYDLVANSTVAGSVVPLSFVGAAANADGGRGEIDSLIITKSTAVSANIRAHFFSAAPVPTVGDNAILTISAFSLDSYIGAIDVWLQDFISGGMLGMSTRVGLPYSLSGGETLYCLLSALGAFVPASGEVFFVRPSIRRFS